MSTEREAISFFRREPPIESDLAGLPNSARDVVVAKVRIVGRVSYLGPRERPSGPPMKDLFGARIEVLEVLRGSIVTGTQLYVVFGEPDPGRDYVVRLRRRCGSCHIL